MNVVDKIYDSNNDVYLIISVASTESQTLGKDKDWATATAIFF